MLLAPAARAGQLPAAVAVAVTAAEREQRVTRLPLPPLSAAEARELVGASAGAVYDDSGGNPFYLEQLARGRGAASGCAPR